MESVTKTALLELAKTNNVEGINTKTTKVDLIAALEAANVEIPGLEPEVQEPAIEEPVVRTAQGKFPGRKLEAKRATEGCIKLTQVRKEVEGKKKFEYVIEHQAADGTRSPIKTMVGSYEDAKFASRDQAVALQVAFDVPQDYTRASK